MSWLRRLVSRRDLERDLDKELTFHIDTRIDELMARGVSAADARQRALAEFGGMEPIKENTRDARGTRWVGDTGQDIRYALRMFLSNKGFSAAAILSLAIGIGANASVFRVINSVVLRPLDVPKPDQLFVLTSTAAQESRFSGPSLMAMSDAKSGATLTAMTLPNTMQVTANNSTALTQVQLVRGNWFDTVGVKAGIGRVFSASEDDLAAAPVAVISERYWDRRFGRNPSAIGSTIRINSAPVTIIGVTPPGFDGINVGQLVDMWVPVASQQAVHHRGNASSDDADEDKPWFPQAGISWLVVVGRLGDGVSSARAEVALAGVYRQTIQERASTFHDAGRRARAMEDRATLTLIPRGLSGVRERMSPVLNLLMGMVALVLLVACANLANLLLARGAARSREFALRLAIGARRGRLIRQLLTESVTLAIIGGAVGFLVAYWGGVALLRLLSNSRTAPIMALPFDWRVVGFGATLTLVTGVAFGLLPALRLSRPELLESMKSGGRVVDAGRKGRVPLVKVLVAVQVAVSMVLLVGALVFFQTFRNLVKIDTGYDRDSVVTVRFDTRLAGYAPEQVPAVNARILAKALEVPGVRSAALARVGPSTGASSRSSINIAGYEPTPGEEVVVNEDIVGPGYVSTLGMRMLAGREFDRRDTESSRKVAIINEAMARKWFGKASPIGRTFGYDSDPQRQNEIVGVVADTRTQGLRGEIPPFAYYALSQDPGEYIRNLYVKTSESSVESVRRDLKTALEAAAPELAVREIVTLGELTERTVSNERMVSNLTTTFGLLGVAVACLGLYGTIAYSVARRTNEIGVRLALGAEPSTVRWMVLRETLTLSFAGAIAGVLLTLPLAKLAGSLVYGLSARDPLTLAVAAASVILIGALAGALPAWRASRVNPTAALRAD